MQLPAVHPGDLQASDLVTPDAFHLKSVHSLKWACIQTSHWLLGHPRLIRTLQSKIRERPG